MPKKERPLVEAADGKTRGGPLPATLVRGVETALTLQRPLALGRLRGMHRRRPTATPEELLAVLERHYLGTVTLSGSAVGAAAVIPGAGTGAALALSGVETLAFLEATTFYAQCLCELHGLGGEDPARTRALVLALVLGREGSSLVRRWAGEFEGESQGRDDYWGEVVAGGLPAVVLAPLLARLKAALYRRLAAAGVRGGLARVLPFGLGALVGGAGNRILAARIVQEAHEAFGQTPAMLPEPLTAGPDDPPRD